MRKVARKRIPAKHPTPWGWKHGDKEICNQDTVAGRLEYKTRKLEMAQRQNWICGCGCGLPMCAEWGYPSSVTFGHVDGRGAGRQDDRIWKDGAPYNRAERYDCNIRLGSPKREKA